MMLVEEGKLKLSDPVAQWLPELKDLKVETASGDVAPARPVWVQDLMRHTSGLVYAGGTKSARIKKLYEDANIEAREVDITGDDMLKALSRSRSRTSRAPWEYSISTDVLGLLIERVAKQPLDQLLKEKLLSPLGMSETAFWVTPEKAARIADALDSDSQKATMPKSSASSPTRPARATSRAAPGSSARRWTT